MAVDGPIRLICHQALTTRARLSNRDRKQAMYREVFDRLSEALPGACQAVYGERLKSLALFGSVARGGSVEATGASSANWDCIVIWCVRSLLFATRPVSSAGHMSQVRRTCIADVG